MENFIFGTQIFFQVKEHLITRYYLPVQACRIKKNHLDWYIVCNFLKPNFKLHISTWKESNHFVNGHIFISNRFRIEVCSLINWLNLCRHRHVLQIFRNSQLWVQYLTLYTSTNCKEWISESIQIKKWCLCEYHKVLF